MGGFRIGRARAQHTYPVPRAIAGAPPSLLQVGSDFTTESFSVASATPTLTTRVQKAAPAAPLLQVPLPGFRRANGLWIQISALIGPEDTGNMTIAYEPWIKFSTVAETFYTPNATIIGATASFDQTGEETPVQTFNALTVTLCALFQLPAASSDVAPIALPAVDDILVGIFGFGNLDFVFSPTTSIVAGEFNASIITQMPLVELITLT